MKPTLFYLLSHRTRRQIYSILRKKRYKNFQDMRTLEVEEGKESCSVKPFLENQTIFVHIPKAAGVSVYKSLFGDRTGIGHYSVKSFQIIFSETEFREFFKFTFVRNPWDRLCSAYHFLQKGGVNEKDKAWAAQNLRAFDTFEKFVLNWVTAENVRTECHLRPQYEYLCLPSSRTPLVDFIGRYENIVDDFAYVAKKLGREGISLRTENVSKEKKSKYSEYYTSKMVDIVGDAYQEDVSLFGYNFNRR